MPAAGIFWGRWGLPIPHKQHIMALVSSRTLHDASAGGGLPSLTACCSSLPAAAQCLPATRWLLQSSLACPDAPTQASYQGMPLDSFTAFQVGDPIPLTQTDNPTQEEVDCIHARVVEEVQALFLRYRHVHPGWASRRIEIV